MSSRHARLLRARIRDALLYWVFIPATVISTGKAVDYLFQLPRPAEGGGMTALSLVLIFAGVFWIQWATRDLSVHGGGTPNPLAPSKRLVTQGAYRLCRHPMFFGYDLTALGVILLSRSLGTLFASYPVFILVQIVYLRREEEKLERRFKTAFHEYRARTPFLIPCRKSWKGRS